VFDYVWCRRASLYRCVSTDIADNGRLRRTVDGRETRISERTDGSCTQNYCKSRISVWRATAHYRHRPSFQLSCGTERLFCATVCAVIIFCWQYLFYFIRVTRRLVKWEHGRLLPRMHHCLDCRMHCLHGDTYDDCIICRWTAADHTNGLLDDETTTSIGPFTQTLQTAFGFFALFCFRVRT